MILEQIQWDKNRKSHVNTMILKLTQVRNLPFYKFYNKINSMSNTNATKKWLIGQNLQTIALAASLNAPPSLYVYRSNVYTA